jgi:hypothetical protein
MKLKSFHRTGLLPAFLFIFTAGQSRAELPPDAQKAVDKGILAAKDAQDYLLAVHYFQEARKIAPGEPDIYYKLGVAESNIPGRELRAICWLEAYLALDPTVPNAAAVKKQIDVLDVKSQSRLSKIIKPVQDAANKISDADDRHVLIGFAGLLAEAGDVAGALKVADTFTGWKGDAYAEIARGQADNGDFEGALKTIREIDRDDVRNVAQYRAKEESAIATIQIEKGCDVAGAKETLRSALSEADSIQDKDTKDDALSDIAEASKIIPFKASNGYRWGAVTMGERGAASDAEDYSFKASQGKSDAGETVVRARIQAAVQPATPVIKVSDWLHLLDDDLNTEPFLDFANYLASLPSSGDAQKQFSAFRDAAKIIIKAQNCIDVMLKLQARQPAAAPDPDAIARNNADQIQGDYARATAINNLIDSELKVGDVIGAQKTADLFKRNFGSDPGWYILARCKIGESQAKAGDMTGAHETFASALQIANPIQDAFWKSTCQGYIATAQANSGDIAGAQKTADLIQDIPPQGKRIEPLIAIAVAQVKAGDIAGAHETFASALKDANQMPDASNKSVYQCEIAVAQAKAGDIAGAQKTADFIQDTLQKGLALCAIAGAQAIAGDFAGAQKNTDLILDPGSKSCSQYNIAFFQANAGNISGAQKSADLIQDANYKSMAQKAIADAQAKQSH